MLKGRRSQNAVAVVTTEPDQAASDQSPSADIPAHVWSLLQQAGEAAAEKLVELLQSPRFSSYTPSAQKQLIELALTRAYGLPVRRSVNVDLSSTDADAIAASLLDMQARLPERQRHGRRAEQAKDVSPGSGVAKD